MFWKDLHRQLLGPTCISFLDLTSEPLLTTAAFSTAGGRSQHFFSHAGFSKLEKQRFGRKNTHTQRTLVNTDKKKMPQNGKSWLRVRRGQRLPEADLSARPSQQSLRAGGRGHGGACPGPKSESGRMAPRRASDPPQNSRHSVFIWGLLRPKLPQRLPDPSGRPARTPSSQRKCLCPELSVDPVTHTHRALHSG